MLLLTKKFPLNEISSGSPRLLVENPVRGPSPPYSVRQTKREEGGGGRKESISFSLVQFSLCLSSDPVKKFFSGLFSWSSSFLYVSVLIFGITGIIGSEIMKGSQKGTSENRLEVIFEPSVPPKQ